ncbi:hypothetical protein E4T81_11055 [Barnesiella sp. WM24]|uniref:hypothetical protein n=1 Tax=Barnesiella sp. WM24 TaxID=2558278 RepID=UPI00107243C7|nr:hypothetical protein [Barnesiella sp. WM24]MDE6113975.1 hypothetical protein [Muribaculum sp.]TFU92666.1 hypothetical protein E4T81_11055 [Barnesiella sp. WM24]
MIFKNSNMRAWIFVISIAFLVIAVFAAQARTERNYRLSAAKHLTLTVDSISYRQALTRVYGKFVGVPHTSQKLHGITVEYKGKSYKANDIDGVDFDRWFQWEDDGVIPVEIDFPRTPVLDGATMVISTEKGVDRCSLTKH